MKATVKINFSNLPFDRGYQEVEYTYEVINGQIMDVKSDHPLVTSIDLIRMKIHAESLIK